MKLRRPGPALVVTVLLAALAMLACAGAAAADEPQPTTLRVELTADIDYVDPALAFYVPTWTIMYATCAKLVNYPDAAAPEGGRLQPEVARAMPTVSADGRTYTFQLRDDFVFSPPSNERLTAAHFKWAIDRALNRLMNSPAQPYFGDIVGAAEVISGAASSVSGVVVEGNTLRITLVRPAGDFLARLAMPFSCPLPLSVPVTPDGIGAPVPSAGPYYIAGWTRNAEILVRENPNYAGGRPHHFDEIHYGIGLPLETIKLGIDAGTTDWGDIPPAAHAELGTRFGDCRPSDPPRRQRYLCYPAPTVHYLAMNHDRPLFGAGGPRGNVALKRAVNFAIDRTAMLEQRGAFAGEPTDQHLPVSLPGFRDADLYPARPDLTKARELAGCDPDCPPRQGVLYCSNRAPAPAICQIAQTNLRAIGIELEIKLFPRATQFELAGRRGEPFDMTLEAWHTEYLDQFSFFQLLDGTRIGPANNVNFAYFNDPDFNARIAAANQLRGSARETAFGLLDVDIARDAAPWAAYGVPNDRYYFSDRVGCQFYSPAYTVNLAALCLRPAISIDDVTVAEGDSGTTSATFSVSLGEAAPGDYPVTVSYATVDGTAGSSDYESAAGAVTFAEGETTKSISVPVSGDTVPEPAETFHVQLSAPTRGTVVRARGTARIVDDDADTTPPANPTSVASATHTPSTWSDDPYVEVTWSGASDDSEVAGYSIEWTEQPDSVPDGSIDLTETTVAEELDDGQSWFHVRAVDTSGNPAVGAAHLGPFGIDTTPPATRELASPTHTPEVWSTNTNVLVRWTVDDETSGIDGFSFVLSADAGSVPDTTKDADEHVNGYATGALAAARVFFHLRAVDNAGNWSDTTHLGPLLLDPEAPLNPALRSTSHKVGTPSRVRTVRVVWTGASDARSGVGGFTSEWSRQADTIPEPTGAAPASVDQTRSPALFPGRWWFHLRTRDVAGNWSATAHLGPFVILGPAARPKPKKVTLCHRGRTIKVPKRQVAKHRKHGDKLGACKQRKKRPKRR